MSSLHRHKNDLNVPRNKILVAIRNGNRINETPCAYSFKTVSLYLELMLGNLVSYVIHHQFFYIWLFCTENINILKCDICGHRLKVFV